MAADLAFDLRENTQFVGNKILKCKWSMPHISLGKLICFKGHNKIRSLNFYIIFAEPEKCKPFYLKLTVYIGLLLLSAGRIH